MSRKAAISAGTGRRGALAVALLAVLPAGVFAQALSDSEASAAAAAVASAAVGPAATESDETGIRLLQATRVRLDVPSVDGDLSDEAWGTAEVARDFLQVSPEPGAAPSQETEVRVLYTDDAIYVGARLFDTQPESIMRRLSRRDEWVISDQFAVAIDSYLDRRTAFVFAVTAAGVQRDWLMFDDTRRDGSWDAVWDVATRVDSLGWVAEFRIPLSQLRFNRPASDAEGMRWGINFERDIARHDEEVQWSPRPADGSRDVSAYGTLAGLQAIQPSRNLEVRPYVVSRAVRGPGAAADPFYQQMDLSGTVGADLKFGITNNLTLNATINPDFGQVEADPAEVNLSAFETFQAERRPFFQEGSDIFDFSLGGGREQVFYSRRIGRRPQGGAPSSARFRDTPNATTILGAAKISGKTSDGWSLGFMNALTSGESVRYATSEGEFGAVTAEPLTNYAVARAIRDFGGGESAIGGIFTATNRRVDPDGPVGFLSNAAYTAGLDFRHRFGGDDFELAGFVLGSHVRGNGEAIARLQRSSTHYFQRPDATHLSYDPDRTALSGSAASLEIGKIGGGHWRWGLRGDARSPGFNVNALGYQRRADQASARASIGYDQFRPSGIFRRWDVELSGRSAWSFGGERIDSSVDLDGSFQLQNFWGFYGRLGVELPALSPTALRGGPALRTPGEYSASLGFFSDSRKSVRLGMNAGFSREEDARAQRVSLSPSLRLQMSSRFQLSMRPGLSWRSSQWQYVTTRASDAGTHYVFGTIDQTTASLTARLDYTFSPRLSLQLYAEPFVSAGRYADFKQAEQFRAAAFGDRFRTYSSAELTRTDGGYEVDVTGNGETDFGFGNPDFNVKQFRSNVVLRWEYRPGSTFYFVWSQDRGGRTPDGSFDLADMAGVFQLEPTNVLLVKIEHWLGF